MPQQQLKPAAAGRRGDDVRSDCWVQLTPTDSGGLTINLQSKVAVLYGDQIRSQVTELLQSFGIAHATVEIEDSGALPFIIAARVAAAAERAGVQNLLERTKAQQKPTNTTTRDRQRRSRLYLPGNEPKFMLNAALHQPDALILDLEDSVAPSEKDAARWLVRYALGSLDFGACERMARINQGELGLTDLDAIATCGVDVILVPKVESPETILTVAQRLEQLNKDQPVYLMPIIESARGAWHAFEIASAHPSVVALAIGLEDYTADLGAQRTAAAKESAWARAQVVNAARAAGVQPIDSVFSDVEDLAALQQNATESRGLGFDGMGCIHPRQIRVIHAAFAPTEQELEKAHAIVAAFKAAQAQGLGVVSLGSKMIDPPVVKRALRLVAQAGDSPTNTTNPVSNS